MVGHRGGAADGVQQLHRRHDAADDELFPVRPAGAEPADPQRDHRRLPHHRRACRRLPVPDHPSGGGRSQADRRSAHQQRHRGRQGAAGAEPVDPAADRQLPDPADTCHLHVLHAPDAGRCRRQGRADELRQVQGQAALPRPDQDHLRRCRRLRRGQGGGRGAGRLPARSLQVPAPGRHHPPRCADGGPAGYRQDAAGQVHRRRGQGAVLLDLRLRLRRDVRRRGCLARARHVRAGQEAGPCIIFIDEIDAVGRSRGAGMGGGNDEREQTLNQLLVEMDGFEANEGIIVIAATNRPDVLDPALLRPGRFDRQVVVPLPDIRGREHILNVHLRKVPLADDVKPSFIARGTPGFSGADLANLVNEAALFAARRNKRLVGMEELELAKDKIMMGAERRSMVMTDKEKLNTAYHESGHAIIGLVMPEHDPVYKVTIIPRGRALGVTMFLPEQDRYSLSRQQIISQICSLFGGRIAEEMTLGPSGVTTGASNDIKRATELAHNMVAKWGLSEEMGPIMYDEDESHQFLGGPGQGGGKLKSGETISRLDKEVRKVIDECYARAKHILEENRDKLDAMAEALMQYETIDADQLKDIMEGRTPRPPKGWDDGDSGAGSPVVDEVEAPRSDEPSTAPTDSGSHDGGDHGDEDEDDEPRRRPSDPLGGPAS
ncbi:ATP-dependent metallopeptidase FtsH/Yme1/Tma family protein [Halomonas sp. E19]|uniref:ATP-dependent metallopeptidase FtsH/Yme1/Tma family protein n=1 Tax=Halomonas sp. E19 TaxID=3397247 RepID=UPI004034B87E